MTHDRLLVLLLAISATTAACAGPAATAVGSPLTIRTAPAGGGCLTAGAAPVQVGHDGTSMTFVEVGTGLYVQLVWPTGFSRRLIDGKAILFARDGAVVGREGGPAIDGITGGLSSDNLFHVCALGTKTY